MGTRAHWFSYRWRTRTVEFDGSRIEVGSPVYCETVADAKADAAEDGAGTVVLERRIGTKAAGYVYEFDRILNPPPPSTCAVPGCGRPISLMRRHGFSTSNVIPGLAPVGWGDSTRDPFYCPRSRDLNHRPEETP